MNLKNIMYDLSKISLIISILICSIVTLSSISIAHKVETPNKVVHQYITNESQFLWEFMPSEIKKYYLQNDIHDSLDIFGYQKGEGVIVGSGEEDKEWCVPEGAPYCDYYGHFWDPDNPQNGGYNDGIFSYSSSFSRAKGLWQEKVIPYYISGNKEKAYYWLGRVVHLLEDATVPAHMHLDPHPGPLDDDSFEEFMVNQGYWTPGEYNYEHFKGTDYTEKEYKFEDLGFGFTEADWLAVNPRLNEVGYPKELFKLFWYTAQKTQYFASDDRPNNMNYQYANGTVKTWDCGGTNNTNLWVNEGYTICPQFTTMEELADDDANNNNGTDLANIANANIPHSMKAIAGLYRLFTCAVAIDWPTFHHDNRRTGYTILKGDFDADTSKSEFTFPGEVLKDYWDSPSIGDIDADGKGELVVGTYNAYATTGRVYALEDDGREKWSFEQSGLVTDTPVIVDLDDDGKKDVVAGSWWGSRIFLLDGKTGKSKKQPYLFLTDRSTANLRGVIRGVAVDDVDLNGGKEVLFSTFLPYIDWQAHLYAVDKNGNKVWKVPIGYNSTVSSGSQSTPAIADIDGDDKPEIVVSSYFTVQAFNGEDGSQLWKRDVCLTIKEAPVIADVDDDNKYEVVINTRGSANYPDYPYPYTCYNRTYVLDGEDGSIQFYKDHGSIQPIDTPAVANLDSDDYLEIVIGATDRTFTYPVPDPGYPVKGKIIVIDGVNNYEGDFTDNDALNGIESAPDILDIDNDDTLEMVFGTKDGYFYVINMNSLSSENEEWRKKLGARMWSSAAIGDLDGDYQTAEIAVKHQSSLQGQSYSALWDFGGNILPDYGGNFYTVLQKTTEAKPRLIQSSMTALDDLSSTITVIDGINEQPQITLVEDMYIIEGDSVNLTTSASDENNDTLNFYFSSPFNTSEDNQSGFWQTDENSSGTYEVLVEVSDENLTDSEFFTLTVYDNGTLLENNFSDGEGYEELNFTQAGNQTVYMNLSKDIEILRAALKLHGYPLHSEENVYQEVNLGVIEANQIDINPNLAVDKDWSTYYSAGPQTGIIVELNDSQIPENPTHIVFHLKLRVFMGGNGRFAIYNYQNQSYEIVTSSIPAFNEIYRDIYFDVYETSPLWTTNDTAFSLRVDNLNDYMSGNNTRWYYKYINANWSSQMVYESEVKFEEDITYPLNPSLDIGNDSIIDYQINGELHDRAVKQDQFNNSYKNETISLAANSSTVRYVFLPKDAVLTRANLNVGNKSVTTLSVASVPIYKEPEIPVEDPYNAVKNINLGPFKFESKIITKDDHADITLKLVSNTEDENVVIRDVFSKTGVMPDGNMWTLGMAPLEYKFKDVGDSVSTSIKLDRNIHRDFKYLLYNYYYLSNGKTKNEEYLQFVNATIKI